MNDYYIGRQEHLSSDEVTREIALIRDHGGTGFISDRAAATIASWWQAPSNPALTALSTTGAADGEAIIAEIDREKASDSDGYALLQLKRWALVSLGWRAARHGHGKR